MKVKFNRFERIAGIFILATVGFAVFSTIGVAIKKGWFASKVKYHTIVNNAEGLHAGTGVQISGLRAGSVTDVELISAEEVRVKFEVFEKFQKLIRQDSNVIVVRPFIIGEKVLDVTVGSDGQPIMQNDSMIVSTPSFDIMDLASGRKLGPFIEDARSLMGNLKVLLKAFSKRERTDTIVQIFDNLLPLIRHVTLMSKGFTKISDVVNKDNRIEVLVGSLTDLTEELAVVLPQFKKDMPDMGSKMAGLVNNLSILANEFKKLTPAISTIAPELPRASQRAVEALDELVVTLKAMQKTFLLSSNVREVKQEELNRQPANEIIEDDAEEDEND